MPNTDEKDGGKKRKPKKRTLQINSADSDEMDRCLSFWVEKRATYLWIGSKSGPCYGWVDGKKLLNFAKALVKELESK